MLSPLGRKVGAAVGDKTLDGDSVEIGCWTGSAVATGATVGIGEGRSMEGAKLWTTGATVGTGDGSSGEGAKGVGRDEDSVCDESWKSFK